MTCTRCPAPANWDAMRADAVVDEACDDHLAAVLRDLTRETRLRDPLSVTLRLAVPDSPAALA